MRWESSRSESVNDVDRYRRCDRESRIASGRNHAWPKQYSDCTFPVVFNCWSQTESVGGAGIEADRLNGIRDVVTGYGGVALVTIGRIECKNPVLGHAVFPRCIDKDGRSRHGLSAKSR